MLPQLLQRVAKHRRGVSSLRFAKVSQTRCPLQCRQSKGPLRFLSRCSLSFPWVQRHRMIQVSVPRLVVILRRRTLAQ